MQCFRHQPYKSSLLVFRLIGPFIAMRPPMDPWPRSPQRKRAMACLNVRLRNQLGGIAFYRLLATAVVSESLFEDATEGPRFTSISTASEARFSVTPKTQGDIF